jgi:hypothetical protein
LLAPRPSRREPLHGRRLTPLATLSSRALSLQYTLHLLKHPCLLSLLFPQHCILLRQDGVFFFEVPHGAA